MNPQKVIADSDESAVVGPQTNANQAGSSSCETVAPVESPPAQVTLHRGERDKSDVCLTIERPASDPGQVSAMVIGSAARARAPDETSANTTAVVQEQAGAAWPLTLDQVIKQTLIRLLRETAGNRRRTASLLGISRSTLYRMLARYDIDHVGRAATSGRPGADRSVLSA